MSKKPKNASQQLMLKNAKKNKVSKNPHVHYLNTEQVKHLCGIGKKKT